VPVEPDLPTEELLGRIDELRSRGQFDVASQELTRALKGGYPPATRERLSFELGAILSRPGSDGTRACVHWREHAKNFPNGRYDREIDQAIKRLGCPGP
jgi:transmembrane sensor